MARRCGGVNIGNTYQAVVAEHGRVMAIQQQKYQPYCIRLKPVREVPPVLNPLLSMARNARLSAL